MGSHAEAVVEPQDQPKGEPDSKRPRTHFSHSNSCVCVKIHSDSDVDADSSSNSENSNVARSVPFLPRLVLRPCPASHVLIMTIQRLTCMPWRLISARQSVSVGTTSFISLMGRIISASPPNSQRRNGSQRAFEVSTDIRTEDFNSDFHGPGTQD